MSEAIALLIAVIGSGTIGAVLGAVLGPMITGRQRRQERIYDLRRPLYEELVRSASRVCDSSWGLFVPKDADVRNADARAAAARDLAASKEAWKIAQAAAEFVLSEEIRIHQRRFNLIGECLTMVTDSSSPAEVQDALGMMRHFEHVDAGQTGRHRVADHEFTTPAAGASYLNDIYDRLRDQAAREVDIPVTNRYYRWG